jgi:hypothetical protein
MSFGGFAAAMNAVVNSPTFAPISIMTGSATLLFAMMAAASRIMRWFRLVLASKPSHLIFWLNE